VAFTETELDELGFSLTIYRPSCMDAFLTVSADTLAWWQRQSPEAQDVLERSLNEHASLPLAVALERLNYYLGRFGGPENVRVWGNGADFDNALLAVAYDAAKVAPGWRFWNNRCYRTLKNQAPAVKLVREGTYHDAYDDAVCQAKHLQQILANLGSSLN
jgi:hypothetical protein